MDTNLSSPWDGRAMLSCQKLAAKRPKGHREEWKPRINTNEGCHCEAGTAVAIFPHQIETADAVLSSAEG